MNEKAHKLKRGSTIVYVVEGENGFRGYFGTCLGHSGDFTATRIKVPAGENYAEGLVTTGVNYYTNVPHGDTTQGATWIWPDEVPSGFYVA